LNQLRARLVAASRKTGVPGRVMVVANPAFNAYSTPDGNIYITMGCLENLKNEDEVMAILAHELSHVLLGHHTSDVVSDVQQKGQALYEIGISAKTMLSGQKGISKRDERSLAEAQIVTDTTDKLVLPAWNRGQEREADFLGVDLLIKSGHSGPAMLTMLEKLRAWEKENQESEQIFWDRVWQTAQRNMHSAVGMTYQKLVDSVSVNHPKTDDRIEQGAEYIERQYGNRDMAEPKTGPWRAVTGESDVVEVMKNYNLAFSARRQLDKRDIRQAYASATASASGRTATDSYPNWVLARSAAALGRQSEAIEALRRAVTSPEPAPAVYDEIIFAYERAGNFTTALEWTDRAAKAFGGAPRWKPPKIRLLRKVGRVSEAASVALDCQVNTPEWRRLCQEANQTPAPKQGR
jgi:beta-barrel assembly-enhancing protease